MKKTVALLMALALCMASFGALADLDDFDIVTTAEDNKVILDTDMGYLGDDAYCMCILAQADAAGWIDLLGVTAVGGNTICAVGANAIQPAASAWARMHIQYASSPR